MISAEADPPISDRVEQGSHKVNDIIDTLRLSEREASELLAEIEKASAGSPLESLRQTKRWRLQSQRAVLSLKSQTGELQRMLAFPRNVSTGGASLLFGGFLHTGTPCQVTLRTLGGISEPVPGVVRRCRHVAGRVHELGIEFDRPVNPREYLISLGTDYLFNAERIDPESIRGRVLIFTVHDADRRSYLRLFDQTKIEFEFSDQVDDAINRLGSDYDLVFADVDDDDQLAVGFAERARRSKRLAPIVIIARSPDPELRLAAIGAGASEMLFKPVESDLLLRATTEYLGSITPEEIAGIESDLRSLNDAPDEACLSWMTQMATLADQLETEVASRNIPACTRCLRAIADFARSVGLRHVAERSIAASRSLERCGQCSGSMPEIRRALRAIRRIGASARLVTPPDQLDAA